MTDGPADFPAQQPYLHDLQTTVKAPVFGLSGTGGALSGQGVAGVFADDRRVLSVSEIALSGARLVPIASELVGADATRSVLVARGLGEDGADPAVWVERSRVLVDGSDSDSDSDSGSRAVVREIVEIRSASRRRVQTTLSMTLGCDLAEISAVKSGYSPGALPAEAVHSGLQWVGLGAENRDIVQAIAQHAPAVVDAKQGRLSWPVKLEPGESARFSIEVSAAVFDSSVVLGTAGESVLGDLRVDSGDIRIGRFVERSLSDLRGLELRDPSAPEDHFLGAGAPWFLTLFGRDSLIAARMLLPLGTELAAGTLRTLARRQGTKTDPETAEQPGKILHEIRRAPASHDAVGNTGGPMTLPSTYYGTVDATPLWIMLLHDAWRWGMPADEVEKLLDPLGAALAWMRDHGMDDAGFLSYVDESGHGLANQGWKDSGDSIQFIDGRIATAPLALSEVQGYAYEAAMSGAALLDAFGRPGADEWRTWAAQLAARFRARFWISDADGPFPAIALDRDGKPVNTVASNMGHLLGTGILNPEESALVAARLGSAALSSGYGLRTMATSAAGYSPLSYHGGSVWTHDTAMAVQGLARAAADGVPGAAESARALIDGLLEAAAGFEYRMPELYAGSPARTGGRPTPYPAACRPQAWAAAAAIAVVSTLVGVRPDAPANAMAFQPLPGGDWDGLTVRGLRVGADAVDVRLDAGDVRVLDS
ncbi:Amylo-alpha-16-glucosidase [Catenulispora acidiphila DSM 44928]|uniref:Amylo-alpha-16-glucosidase n=1 Tax=Catenulispora acidiphila (strain DSM 44928 / JCM 14897 / NBRC 102108 / NRRL B-24433 / ID139908) TaxID=479433 RepID=C7Q087_CATAD|nr:glycogen debranching N-terminal domain-containing protein [Catenulispora acidiphila]ACU75580.1 Amylo-alpha-16-glucosidase [Catenulispora acidiphila DSM 44928]